MRVPLAPQDFEKGVADIKSRDVIEMMMITQYFDMLKDVGEKNATIFLNHAPSAVGDLAGQVGLVIGGPVRAVSALAL